MRHAKPVRNIIFQNGSKTEEIGRLEQQQGRQMCEEIVVGYKDVCFMYK